MMRVFISCLAASVSLLFAGIAEAGSTYTVTLTQEATDVLASGSGTIDLTGLDSFGSTTAFPELYPDHGIMGVGPGGGVDFYAGLNGPSGFGPGFGGFPIAKSGDTTLLEDFGIDLFVPQGYVSNTFLSGSATYAGTLASNGLAPGTYTWTWNDGANQFVIDVPSFPATPEPATWAMLAIGFAGLGIMGWRGSRKIAARAA